MRFPRRTTRQLPEEKFREAAPMAALSARRLDLRSPLRRRWPQPRPRSPTPGVLIAINLRYELDPTAGSDVGGLAQPRSGFPRIVGQSE